MKSFFNNHQLQIIWFKGKLQLVISEGGNPHWMVQMKDAKVQMAECQMKLKNTEAQLIILLAHLGNCLQLGFNQTWLMAVLLQAHKQTN